MTQLLAHLVGDFVLQSHAMAIRKTSSWRWAFIHATFYTLPFLFLTQNPIALLIIGGTHAVIDRLGIARRWCQFYGVGHPGLWAKEEGFEYPPGFIGVWLTILVDQTMHLTINYFTLYHL